MIYKLTAYELFAIAVIAMLVDHAGLYFGHGMLWMRVFRMFTLVWLIPIGYNPGRRAGMGLWAGMLVLTVIDWRTGLNIFPLNILATIIVIKLIIDPLMERAVSSKRDFWLINLLLLMLIPITYKIVEYGTLGLLLAAAGWLLRHKDKIPPKIVNVRGYFILVSAVYIIVQQFFFRFSLPQFTFMAITTLLTALLMLNFKQLITNALSKKNKDPIEALCRFIGHKTLEIYVVSFIILKALFFYTRVGP